MFVLWIVSCTGQNIALADAGNVDWEIDAKSDVIHIKAGIIQRTIARNGTNIATTGLTVDGVDLLARPAQELSVTFYRAKPNRRPVGLRPGQGGEILSIDDFRKQADKLVVRDSSGKVFTGGVQWVDPLKLNAAGWSDYFSQVEIIVNLPRRGVRHLEIKTTSSATSPIPQVSVISHYEIYEGFPVIRKWVTFENNSSNWYKIDGLVIDDIQLADDYLTQTSLTPSEWGAKSSIISFSTSDRSRGIIAVSEIPSALRTIDANGSMKYTDEYFEWVLGPGERFVSEPVFHFAFSAPVYKTISGVSSALDRTVERPFQRFLEKHIGIAGRHGEIPVPMWCSWSNFAHNVTAEDVRIQAPLVARAGFECLELDDGWQKGRLGTEPDTRENKFPDFQATCDYILQQGLKLGLWVSCYRDPDSKDLRDMPNAACLPIRRHRPNGIGMSFCSPWRNYYADELVRLHKQYGAIYFKQDFTNIQFGEIGEGHESRTRKESILRGLRGLLEAQDLMRKQVPGLRPQITHEIYWGTPGTPCDLAALKHATCYHIPPNDYSGVGRWKNRYNPDDTLDPQVLSKQLIKGCLNARNRFFAHRGLPLYGIEYYGASTYSFKGSLTKQIQDRQICSWLMGVPSVFHGDMTSLADEQIRHYRKRFDLVRQLQSKYDIYYYFQYSGVPGPTDEDWHWWGKLNEQAGGAVVVVRGGGGLDKRTINIPWVAANSKYRVTVLFQQKDLGTFTGLQLQQGVIEILLPRMGQDILEITPVS